MTPVILLQVYIVITSRTSQGLHICQVAFVQRLHLTWSISPLNQHVFKQTTSTLFILYPYLFYWCLPLFLLYNPPSSSRLCVSSLGPHGSLPRVSGYPTNVTRCHCQIFWYVEFVRGGWRYWDGVGGGSPFGGYNPCLVPKSGFQRKEFLGDHRDGSEVLY